MQYKLCNVIVYTQNDLLQSAIKIYLVAIHQKVHLLVTLTRVVAQPMTSAGQEQSRRWEV